MAVKLSHTRNRPSLQDHSFLLWILFWKIALQFLAVAIAILVNVLDYVSSDKRTKKFRRRRRLLFALSAIFLIASIIVVIGDELAKRQEISEIANRLSSLQQQGEIAKHLLLTGGDSYCYLNSVGDDNSQDLVLVHQGKYPLYDLQIRMVDLDKFDAITKANPRVTLKDIAEADFVYHLPTLNPDQAVRSAILCCQPIRTRRNITSLFWQEMESFSELIRFRRLNGVWLRAFRVQKSNTSPQQILIERIQDGFPRGERGEVAW